MRVAVKRGSTLYHLYGDHLGSTSLTTQGSSTTASRAYYAYGAERAASGDLRTDHTFTGQKRDATGLMYYNARYYDPALGTFISPDSMVPGAGQVINYNRYLYARGNPLKYTDPTGQSSALGSAWVQEFTDVHGRAPNERDRADRLISLTIRGSGPGGSWKAKDWKTYTKKRSQYVSLVLQKAGITIDDTSWNSDPKKTKHLDLLTEGVLKFGEKIATLIGSGIDAGLEHLRDLIGGGVQFYRASAGAGWCERGDACATEPGKIGFFDNLFAQGSFSDSEHENFIRGTAVHELAHKIHIHKVCPNNPSAFCLIFDIGESLYWDANPVTGYDDWYWERWAEMVTDWVYDSDYQQRPEYETPRNNVNADQIKSIERILGP